MALTDFRGLASPILIRYNPTCESTRGSVIANVIRLQMPFTKHKTDRTAYRSLVSGMTGLPVARVWFGDNKALYLEVGNQIASYESGELQCEHSIYFGFDWKYVPIPVAIADGQHEINAFVRTELIKKQIRNIEISRQMQIEIQFSAGSLVSLQDPESKNPDWCIHTAGNESIYWEDGSWFKEISGGPNAE